MINEKLYNYKIESFMEDSGHYSINDLGSIFNLNKEEIYKVLEELEWIKKIDNEWKLTDYGKSKGGKENKLRIFWKKEIKNDAQLINVSKYYGKENKRSKFKILKQTKRKKTNKSNSEIPSFFWVAISIFLITVSFAILYLLYKEF